MTKENIFEYATYHKLRFPFKGMISTEDLWDLSLPNLDSIYKTLNKQLKELELEGESLLNASPNTNTETNKKLEIQIDIIKHIVNIKLAEKESKEKAVAKKEQKQKLMSIIATKENEKLLNTPIDDLKKMLNKLDG